MHKTQCDRSEEVHLLCCSQQLSCCHGECFIYISMLAGFRDVIESNMAPDEHNKQKDSHHFKKMFVLPKQSSETRDWATSTDTNQVSHLTAFLSVHPFPGKPLSLNRS